MAATLQFKRDSTSLDLLGGTVGYTVLTWSPKVATPLPDRAPEPVNEELTLRLTGTSHDDMASRLQSLADMQRWALEDMYDPAGTTPVWLHAKTANETSGRRALVRRLDIGFGDDAETAWYGVPVDDGKTVFLGASVERAPYWEGTAASGTVSTAPVSSIGGVWDYTGSAASDVTGDVSARMGQAWFWDDWGTSDYLWVGFRSANKYGDLSSYDPVMELYNETLMTDAGTAADATAKGGTQTKVTFATQAGWFNRAVCTHDLQGAGDVQGNRGRHLMLLRAYMGGGGTAEVRTIRYHASAAEDGAYSQPVSIAGTAWSFYELGLHDNVYMPNLEIDARRTSAAGTLYMDCLVFLPVDEYYLFLHGTNMMGRDLSTSAQFITRPDDSISGWSGNGSRPVPDVMQSGAGIPPGDGRAVICAAQAQKECSLMHGVGRVVSWYPRWLSLRGSE